MRLFRSPKFTQHHQGASGDTQQAGDRSWKYVMLKLRQRIHGAGFIMGLGAVILAVLIGLVVREQYLRYRARIIPPYAANLDESKVKELQAKIATQEAAIRQNSQDFNAHVELALAKAELGDRDGAAEVYRMMNQRFPGNYLSYQNLGVLYEEVGKYEMAAEQYLIAIQNAPRIPHEYRYLVNLYTYKLPERASDIPRVLLKGLVENPNSTDLMAMMAVYYRDHGQPEEAIHWYEQLLVFDQNNTTALEELKGLKEQTKK
ncbi:MAG: hypothetical protein V1723_04975 [Candidatus Uhrbacteria bacterium]